MAAAGGAAVALVAGANGSSGVAHSVEEAVLAVCKQHEQVWSTCAAARGTPLTLTLRCTAQGLSQDQLAAALPAIDVQRVAEALNTLLSRVRSLLAAACSWKPPHGALTCACGLRVEYSSTARALAARLSRLSLPCSSSSSRRSL